MAIWQWNGNIKLGGPTISSGTGDPRGTPAPVGSLYLRKDGAAGTGLYVKESTADSGWNIPGIAINGVLQVATIQLSGTQLSSLHAIPVELVPTPGAEKMIVVQAVHTVYSFMTTPYVSGSAIGLYLGPAGNGWKVADVIPMAQLQGSSSRVVVQTVDYSGISYNQDAFDLNGFVNQRLSITCTGADYSGGDGTLTVSVYYMVVPNEGSLPGGGDGGGGSSTVAVVNDFPSNGVEGQQIVFLGNDISLADINGPYIWHDGWMNLVWIRGQPNDSIPRGPVMGGSGFNNTGHPIDFWFVHVINGNPSAVLDANSLHFISCGSVGSNFNSIYCSLFHGGDGDLVVRDFTSMYGFAIINGVDSTLTTIDMTNMGNYNNSLNYVQINVFPMLTTVTLPVENAWSLDGYAYISFNDCALTQASIDGIIAVCLSAAGSNGRLHLDGGTNSAPSSTGADNILALVSDGWTVTTN